jgi:hypothetical protein
MCSYIEGIDVLYGTNTFHMWSMDLLLNLPHLLPRHGLERIKPVELFWKLGPIDGRNQVPMVEDTVEPLRRDPMRQDLPLHRLCALLPEALPYLDKLYISFQCWLNPGCRGCNNDNISEMETLFLGPVEHMLRTFGPTSDKKFNVAIQQGGWFILLRKHN